MMENLVVLENFNYETGSVRQIVEEIVEDSKEGQKAEGRQRK